MFNPCEIVLVCGGRKFRDTIFVFEALDEIAAEYGIDLLVHGGAAGADTIADEWAKDRGVPPVMWAALWDAEGRAAGPQRNGRMFDFMQPTRVVAFPGGVGTNNMLKRTADAIKKGMKVVIDVRDP